MNKQYHAMSMQELIDLQDENDKLKTQISIMQTALETLAKLGNGEEYGNSVGNCIAQDALRKIQ